MYLCQQSWLGVTVWDLLWQQGTSNPVGVVHCFRV